MLSSGTIFLLCFKLIPPERGTYAMRTLFALACLIAATPALAQEPSYTSWDSRVSTDAITDAVRTDAWIGSPDGLVLAVLCTSPDSFSIGLAPTDPLIAIHFIAAGRTTEVAWRVDQSPAHFDQWSVRRGTGGSPYTVSTRNTLELTEAILAGGDEIMFRVHGITTTFTLSDAQSHITRSMSACGARRRVDIKE